MKIHLVPHQHFDLIWRRPVLWYRERRAQLFRQILALLTANEDFTYSFSQVLALKEFLEDSPGEWDTVERLIRAGRLEWIGGSLSIPDLNMISPDALIRNIQAGRRYLHEEFGCEVIVGAFEDAFGVSAQLPQILSLCGYQYYKAGRMPRGMGAEPSGCFRWEAQDGTEIRCIANSPDGMSWGWGHPDNPDEPPASHAERRKRLETELRNAVRGALHSGLSDALVTCMGEEHDVFSEFIPLVRELRSELAESGIELEFSTLYRMLHRADRKQGTSPSLGIRAAGLCICRRENPCIRRGIPDPAPVSRCNMRLPHQRERRFSCKTLGRSARFPTVPAASSSMESALEAFRQCGSMEESGWIHDVW